MHATARHGGASTARTGARLARTRPEVALIRGDPVCCHLTLCLCERLDAGADTLVQPVLFSVLDQASKPATQGLRPEVRD